MCQQLIKILIIVAVSAMLGFSVAADWLVKKNGDRIETQGPPWIDRSLVRYTAMDNSQHSIPAADIDFAATIAANSPPSQPDQRAAERADIIVYTTSWCGYCRRTLDLLDELGADYVERDIEKSKQARLEHSKVAGGVGVPVLDIRGKIIRGFKPDEIRSLVAELEHES